MLVYIIFILIVGCCIYHSMKHAYEQDDGELT